MVVTYNYIVMNLYFNYQIKIWTEHGCGNNKPVITTYHYVHNFTTKMEKYIILRNHGLLFTEVALRVGKDKIHFSERVLCINLHDCLNHIMTIRLGAKDNIILCTRRYVYAYLTRHHCNLKQITIDNVLEEIYHFRGKLLTSAETS